MRRHSFLVVLSTIMLGLLSPAANAEGDIADAKPVNSALLVPFGVSSVDDATLAAALTRVSNEAVAEAAVTVALAKAPLVDILTLIECPSGEDSCIGGLAEALDVDLAITGRVVSRDGNAVAEVIFVRRDGSIEKLRHLVSGANADEKTLRYRIAIRRSLKLGPAETTFANAEDPRVDATLDPFSNTNANTQAETSAEMAGAPEPSAVFEPPAPEQNERRAGLANVRPLSWATAAGGLIAVGVGTAFYAKASSTESEIDDLPTPASAADFDRLVELEDRGDREKTTGAVFLTLGVAATTAGVALILWDSSRPQERTSVAVTPSNGGVVASVAGSF